MEDDLIIVIKGTELKLYMQVDMGGIQLMDCDFTVTAYASSRTKLVLKKEDCIPIQGNGTACFIPIDTKYIDPGVLTLDVSIDIPDDDFTDIGDGCRTEIYRKKTNIKIKM